MANSDAQVILNGSAYDGWEKISVSNSFEETTGAAKLTISEQPNDPLPADIGDEAQIILAGKPVLTGFVKKVNGTFGYGQHEITLTLKDKTDDLVKSTIGPALNLKAPIKLKDVAEKTIKEMGLDIKVIEKVQTEIFKQGEVVSGAIDERGQRFLDSWARKRGIILNTDGEGNLVLNQNQKERASAALISGAEDTESNNVLSSTYDNSEEGRSGKYSAVGQKSANDKDYWEGLSKSDPKGSAKAMQSQWGHAFDTAIRPQLKLHFRGGRGMQGQTPEESAKWAANINRARNFTYKATVQGFTQGLGGALWWPGLLVPVRDYHWLIDQVLFLKAVSFTKTWGEGGKTDLDLTVEDAYSPQAEPQGAQARTKITPLGGVKKGRYDPDTGVRRLKGLE